MVHDQMSSPWGMVWIPKLLLIRNYALVFQLSKTAKLQATPFTQKGVPFPLALSSTYTREPHSSSNVFGILDLQPCVHHLLRSRLLHITTHHVHRMAHLDVILF